MYIYKAEAYCDDCGGALCVRLPPPSDPQDENSYDSDTYPKGPIEPGTADVPQHCAAGSQCVNAMRKPLGVDGECVGAWLGTSLTAEGERYVVNHHRENPSDITRFWLTAYELWPTSQRHTVYVVATLKLSDTPGELVRDRVPLVCSSLLQACTALAENWGDMNEGGYYPVALVEPVVLNRLYGGAVDKRWWFRFDKDSYGYVPMAEPPGFERIIGITMVGS